MKAGFIKTHFDLGNARVGKEYIVKFNYNAIQSIDKMKASCDCFSAHNDKANDRLTVRWKPREIPKHLEEAGQYQTEKTIEVLYTTETRPYVQEQIILSFKATVTK